MPAEITGTPTPIAWGASVAPTPQDIIIPADATAVYMFWSCWLSTAGAGLAAASLNGSSPTETFQQTVSGNAPANGVAAWFGPGVGTQSLQVVWNLAPTEGPTCIVVYTRAGANAWREAAGDQQGGIGPASVTLTTQPDDLVIKHDQLLSASAPALTTGWTNGQTQTGQAGQSARNSWILAAGSSQVAASEGTNRPTVTAIVIPPVGNVGQVLFDLTVEDAIAQRVKFGPNSQLRAEFATGGFGAGFGGGFN